MFEQRRRRLRSSYEGSICGGELVTYLTALRSKVKKHTYHGKLSFEQVDLLVKFWGDSLGGLYDHSNVLGVFLKSLMVHSSA